MKKRFLAYASLTMLISALSTTFAETPSRTLNYVGANSGLWSVATNWKDAAGGTNAVPRSGDIVSLPGCQWTKNDIENLHLKQIKVTGYQAHNSSSQPIYFDADCLGFYNTGYLHYDLPSILGATNITVYSSDTMVIRNSMMGLNGADCGIVKTGGGRAGINGQYAGGDVGFKGFRYMRIEGGQWILGINGQSYYGLTNAIKDAVITFANSGTKLGVSAEIVLANAVIREEGTALTGAHAINSQVNNVTEILPGRLTLTGTPSVDSMVFTGTFENKVSFRWKPNEATKEFVISGRASTTVGNLEVANGTLRLTKGATFTQLGKLSLTGGSGSTLAVDTIPAAAFHAKSLLLTTGNEKFSLAAGVTLTVGTARVANSRQAPGTYTAANADWITGGGSITVEGYEPCELKWSGNGTDTNWSNPDNWINQTTLQHDLPRNGDTLSLKTGGGGQTPDMNATLRPYRINIPGSYSDPRSPTPLVFEEGSWGIWNEGYMYVYMPIIVRAKKLTMYCSNTGGYTDGFYNDQGQTFGFEKTGTGCFAFKTGASQYDLKFTGLKDILITAGSVSFGWQKWGDMSHFEPGIEVTFNGKNTSLQFDQNTTFTNFVIRETAAAIGQTHTIAENGDGNKSVGEKTFTITGAPALSPMVFTGDIRSPMNFTWAPTNDFNTFTFSGQVVTCSGTITAAGGVMRLQGGATFSQLGTLALKGGSLTTFEVVDQPSQPTLISKLTLDTGLETIRIDNAVSLNCETLTVNGETVAPGVYCSNLQLGGTAVPWIKGTGFLSVGGATAPTAPTVASVSAKWDAGGGTDTKLNLAANWENDTLPDLDSGSLAATFASGSGASLAVNAAFHKMEIASPNAWAFTAEGSSWASLGAGGLATAGKGLAFNLGWPIFLWNEQTWTIGAGDTLNVNANIAGASPRLALQGQGTVNLNTELGHDGKVVISNAVVNVNADNAFGASTSQPVEIDMDKSKLYLNGVTVNRTIKNIAQIGNTSGLYVKAGTTNVINGDLDVSRPYGGTLNMSADATLRIKGKVKRAVTAWYYFGGGSADHPATYHLDGPTDVVGGSAFATSGSLNLYLNAPSNDFGYVWFWLTASNMKVYTTVPYAFVDIPDKEGVTRLNMWGGSNNSLDLCGNDQSASEIGASSGWTITSDTPATLHLTTPKHSFDFAKNGLACAFAGAASLAFDGSYWTKYSGASTSTGCVEVTKGELRFEGMWPTARAAILKGGQLSISNRKAFSKATDLVYTGGTLNLNYAGKMRLHELTANGVQLPHGVYGASDNTSVESANRLGWIAGTGLIGVFGDNGPGFQIIIK